MVDQDTDTTQAETNADQPETVEETAPTVEATAAEAPQPGAAAQPVKVEATPVAVEEISDEDRDYGKPNGAFLFVILLAIFYVFYWSISYFEIFVIRGA